ncbi:helix-turn-helix transcriptional regulator [Anditalea andensis]|uniref:Excisionase n=1 Tax=Anditalea andensis TaxID=1048983 RepID=A0A074KP76_9BACT|nr:helix-turn-helix domain-containing protein [Anditalea andensis]KEO71741.1 excisionase [Anditalea andensis]
MENELILHKLNRIEKFIFGLKDILNTEELSDYTGFKISYIYKLVNQSKIPYSKPNGGSLFFECKKIDAWLLQNPSKSVDEIKREAFHYTRRK